MFFVLLFSNSIFNLFIGTFDSLVPVFNMKLTSTFAFRTCSYYRSTKAAHFASATVVGAGKEAKVLE